MQQDAVLEFLRGNDLKLSGDSPGYSAKYCAYSLMDFATDLILDYKLIQSPETGISIAMEKEGLRRSLNYLLEQGVSIVTIATGRHRGVGALMKLDYLWYMTKSLVKQLTQNTVKGSYPDHPSSKIDAHITRFIKHSQNN